MAPAYRLGLQVDTLPETQVKAGVGPCDRAIQKEKTDRRKRIIFEPLGLMKEMFMKKNIKRIVMSMMIAGCMTALVGCNSGVTDGDNTSSAVSAESVNESVNENANEESANPESSKSDASKSDASKTDTSKSDASKKKQESAPTLDELIEESHVEVMIPDEPVEEMTPTDNIEIGIGEGAKGSF